MGTSRLHDLLLPDLLTVEDLARHLRRSHSAIRALLRAGDIPGRRIGRRWIVDRGALLRSLDGEDRGSRMRLLRPRGSPERLDLDADAE